MSIKITTLVLCFFFLLPLFASFCSQQPQSNCGVNGTECQYHQFNGSCIFNSTCPSGTIFLNSTYNCEACVSLKNQSNCADCSQFGFIYYKSRSLCATCQSIYGSSCSKCNSSACQLCNGSGLSLAPDSQSCVNTFCNISYCINCSNSTACSSCDNQHMLFQGICICKISNCQACAKPSICQICSTGYRLTSGLTGCTADCIPNCINCNDPTTCTTCATGYTYQSSNLGNLCKINCSQNVVPNCLSCTSLNYCDVCKSGYVISSLGSACSQNVTCNDVNCLSCNSSNATLCTKCNTGYRIENGSCLLDTCVILNCMQCQDFKACQICSQNYVVSNNGKECKPSCNVSNCKQCANTTACSQCMQGYKVESGRCTSLCIISNCKLCRSIDACKKCEDGYKIQGQKTCSFDCKIDGCIVCASTSTCQTCKSEYALKNGICGLNCQKGKYLTKQSTCKQCRNNCVSCFENDGKVICSECSDLYYLQSSSRSCFQCSTIPNCFSCSSNSKNCITCSQGFILTNNSCVAPPVCSVTNCYTCASSAFCSKCIEGYQLDTTNGTCSKPSCFPGQSVKNGICTCGSQAYQLNRKCEPCSDINCLTCSVSSCSSCRQRFFPKGTSCSPCISNCKTCTTSTVCSDCEEKYSLISGACQSASTPVSSVNGTIITCPAGCQACTLDVTGKVICTKSQQNFAIWLGQIFICDPKCKSCREVINPATQTYSYCRSCNDGQGLQGSDCVNCTDPHASTCSEQDVTYSIICVAGYTAVNGLCTLCGQNCLKCNIQGNGSCDEGACVSGFVQMRGDYTCTSCVSGCTTCDSANPNNCLDCGRRRFSNNGICQSCSSNCIQCNSTTCTDCDGGFVVSSDGSCKVPPGPPCVAYNSALVCTNCSGISFVLQNGVCIFNAVCNDTGTCPGCSFGFYFLSGRCYRCPQMFNCLSCNVDNSSQCLKCADGYYLDSAYTCTQCVTGCASCRSKFYCTRATDGYYLQLDTLGESKGSVLACNQICRTCYRTNTSCLSCKDDATISGGFCQKKIYHQVKLVAKILGYSGKEGGNDQLAQFFIKFVPFLEKMCPLFGFKVKDLYTCLLSVQPKKASSGSVILSFTIDANKGDPSKILPSGGDLGPLNILSVDSTLVGATSSSTTSSVSLGLVLGVAIPLGVLLIAIIVIIKVKFSSSTEQEMFDPSEKQIEFNEQF